MVNKNIAQSGKTVLIVLASLVVLGLAYGGCVLSFRGDCVRAENGIEAQLEVNKASHDTMWKEVREVAQVSDMMRDDFIKVFDGAMRGRYGEDGSRAVFQWIQEQNPSLDPGVYQKIQVVIEKGRARFLKDQEQLVDKVRNYKDLLEGNRAILANAFLGFPRKIDPDDEKFKPITSGRTKDAFERGEDGEIKLRD